MKYHLRLLMCIDIGNEKVQSGDILQDMNFGGRKLVHKQYNDQKN